MKYSFLFLCFISVSGILTAQNYFRSGIFLHHSTGNYIWGPNPDGNSTTTIPEQMHLYNTQHSFFGNDSITMNEEWWSPDDNEWSTQHEFFEGNTAYTDINEYLAGNKIVVVKSCFPSSALEAWGDYSDTLNPTYKSVYNYKWHWRHILHVMKNHPENFFAIWTNAPLEVSSTTISEAALSKSFCKWAKDTLADGMDPEFGAFPANVYVFDFFSKLTGSNGMMLNQYRTAEYDSHPNGTATDLVAPQFVHEIFDAAIDYETLVSETKNNIFNTAVFDIYPNPAEEYITIKHGASATFNKNVSVQLYDIYGKIILYRRESTETFHIDIRGLAPGVYIVKISCGNTVEVKRFVRK
ncbi:MAG: T9SS type A sorting domain-containing protein [Bacteroidia bacterium]|nr:T9SS type A sorting domain-containing protein [Bacteroidia bacterium]